MVDITLGQGWLVIRATSQEISARNNGFASLLNCLVLGEFLTSGTLSAERK